MARDVDIWTGKSTGHDDPDDPEVVTVAWAVREGVVILSADVLEGGLLVVRARVPENTRAEGTR